jgi:sulfotransferase
MTKVFYFMAGLPRSGSSVLSAILNQNPKFYSGPSSPVLSTMFSIENHLLNDELFNGYPKLEQAKQIISSIPFQFYNDKEEEVIIDKNRAWPGKVPYIEGYIKQQAKIICPVRDIDEILTSMIMMIRRNPYQEGQGRINFIDEQLVKLNIPLNDENRCEYIAGAGGILGQSLNAIAEGFNQGFGDRIYFVEYKDLVDKPEETLQGIYNFLGEKYYEHIFGNLESQSREEDLNTYGLADMHEVHKELKSIASNPKDILSPEILKKCKGMDIWRTSLNNTNQPGA